MHLVYLSDYLFILFSYLFIYSGFNNTRDDDN